jgi:histidinol-phosphatase
MSDDLALALAAADDADRVSLARFRAADLVVETKPDLTPVSDADRAVEAVVHARVAARYPQDAMRGEETGTHGSGARLWVVDPIDGTKNFVRGVPVWATLIALLVDDQPVVGVVSAPALSRRWWAEAGGGAWVQEAGHAPRRCRVSAVTALADASLSYSSRHGWEERGLGNGFDTLVDRCWRSRAYGDFWSYLLLAEGAVDVAAEPQLALHDMAALVPIVAEAGGRFTSVAGVDGPWGGDAVASNGHLHAAVLDTLLG